MRKLSAALAAPIAAACLWLMPVAPAHATCSPATASSPSRMVDLLQLLCDQSLLGIGGTVAGGSADSGNPVKTGGVYNTSPPTYTNGQRTDTQVGPRGQTSVFIQDPTGVFGAAVTNPGDSDSANQTAVAALSRAQLYNGTSWERERANLDVTLLASGAQTATQTTADQTNYNARCVKVTLDITAAGTGTITPEIDFKDPASGKYTALVTGTAQAGTGTTTLSVCPGITVAANVSVSDVLPRTWRVKATKSDSSSWTFSLGAMIIR